METTTTAPKKNIFATAKKAEPKVTKADKKIIVLNALENKVSRFNALKGMIDSLEAEKKMLEGDLKAEGKRLYCNQFVEARVKPESFCIEDAEGGRILFMATDKYTNIPTEKLEVMEQLIPSLLETKTTYGFDPIVLERNIELLSDAILASNMSEEDKGNLIIAQEVTSVKKGSIDVLHTTNDLRMAFDLINPVCMLKPQA